MAAPEIDEFEIMRRRIRGQGAQRADQSGRELQRRFAALGNLDSGAALSIQQQNAQAQEDLTSGQEQEVNALQAQTQRAERQAEQDRILQRYGIDTQAGTSRYVVGKQGETQLGVANIGAASDLAVAGKQGETQLGVAGIGAQAQRDVAKTGAESDLAVVGEQGRQAIGLQTLRGTQEATLQAERVKSAEEQAQKDRVHQGDLAYRDEVLKRSGLDIQKRLANAGILKDQQEGFINSLVTFIDGSNSLKQAGMKPGEIKNVFKALKIPGLNDADLDKIYALPPVAPVAPARVSFGSSSNAGGGGNLPFDAQIYRFDPSTGITYYKDSSGQTYTR